MATTNDIIKFGNTSFYAKSIVDLVIYVNVDTPVYRYTQSGAKPVFNIKKGGAAGKLYSYINPGNDTQNQWLMFYDSNNKPYYIKVTNNNINIGELLRQGAKTVDTLVKEKKDADKTTFEKIKEILLPIAFLTAIVAVLKK